MKYQLYVCMYVFFIFYRIFTESNLPNNWQTIYTDKYVFTMIKRCVHEIRDGETIYNRVDMSEKELEEFIDSLTGNQFEGLSDFFSTMPKVQHSVEVTNPKTKKKGEVVIEGIQSFFD